LSTVLYGARHRCTYPVLVSALGRGPSHRAKKIRATGSSLPGDRSSTTLTRLSLDTDLLFTSSAGTALSRNNFRTKYWHPAVQKAKLEHSVTFHNLRAAHASWLLAGDADIVVVQERLGHRRITTTQQYTGTLPDAGDRALAALRKIRKGATPRQPRAT
jgi:integrase